MSIHVVKQINYALVEETRPPLYTAMKYWGKKPHNIWREYVKTYCPEDGFVLDPFAGSAMSAFEAVQAGRKSLCFDLNPMTAFFVEVITSKFDEDLFIKYFREIEKEICADPIYIKHYTVNFKGENAIVYNYRWLSGEVDEIVLETDSGKKIRTKATLIDKEKSNEMKLIEIPYWYPNQTFPKTPSINQKFIKDVGGDNFHYLWTRRNLYILSKIFHEILKVKDVNVKIQLISGFVQTLHLTFKMVVPRSKTSKRDFSGSWGRADYMIRSKSMEQNPLIIFRRSCIEKQSIVSCMKDATEKIPADIKISFLNEKKKINKNANINYGILDIADLTRYVKPKSVDFIITDPPYAGLVCYLDLSLIWLVWLQKFDKKYIPDLASEITIKKNYVDREQYRLRLNNALKQLHVVLRDDGYLVITFHHKKIKEWNDFVNAVKIAGFKFDKVTHQYNRRSGESNVSDPYGTSGADFYVRCVKHREVDFSDDKSGLKHFIKQKTIEIISLRNEPTPYTFIVAGLIPEMVQAGYINPKEYSEEIEKILKEDIGKDGIFIVKSNTQNKSGDLWWFREPAKYINYPDRPLKDRVDELVLSILRRKISVKLDDVIGELYQTYPNGLTPDTRNLSQVLQKYAYKAGGFWKIKIKTIKIIKTHSDFIGKLCGIGKKSGFKIYVGKREQPETYESGKTLADIADTLELNDLKDKYDERKLDRVGMIDVVWLSNDKKSIKCIFEVENSTGFTSAIQRASNIEEMIPKFMVIPNKREKELKRVKDPLFLESFKKNNWRYITYDSVSSISTSMHPTIDEFTRLSRSL